MGTVFSFYRVMSYQTSTSISFIYQSGCQTPMASETFNLGTNHYALLKFVDRFPCNDTTENVNGPIR